MPTCPVPTVRIEAAIDLPWLLQPQGDGYGFGVRHPSTPVSVLGVPADGVAIAGVRTAISAVRDRRDWRVSEGAAVEWTDAENLGGNSASVRSALSTGQQWVDRFRRQAESISAALAASVEQSSAQARPKHVKFGFAHGSLQAEQ